MLTFSSLNSFSQNLIPNYSFEQYSQCPYSENQTHFAIPWFNPTEGSSDYFNGCFSAGVFSVDVPNNWIGNQNAKTGFAYAGGAFYADSSWNLPDYREYIEVKLLSSLQANKKYYAEFFISLADSSDYSTDDIGVYFSVDSIINDTFVNLSYAPQVNNLEGNVISDTSNWTKVSGTFIAQGGEQFMIIGNFKNDINTDAIKIGNNNFGLSYYFIDDVFLSEDTTTLINENNFYSNVKIYPLGNGLFNLVLNTLSSYEYLKVTNLTGQEIFPPYKGNNNNFILDLRNYVSGVYFISFGIQNKVITQKIFLNQ